MSPFWVVVETAANAIECACFVWFLNHQFENRLKPKPYIAALVSLFLILMSSASAATFGKLPVAEGLFVFFSFLFLVVAKKCRFLSKILMSILPSAIAIGISLLAGFFVMLIRNSVYSQVISNQDSTHMIAIFTSKILQVFAFGFISGRRERKLDASRSVSALLFATQGLNLGCLLSLYVLSLSVSLNRTGKITLCLVVFFVLSSAILALFLFEIFCRQQVKQMDALQRVQRLEMQEAYFAVMSLLSSELRHWRHDYKNHMLSALGYLQRKQYESLEQYLQEHCGDAHRFESLVNTENVVLHTLANSKLTFAKSKNITVTANVQFPAETKMTDMDLTTLFGNLLDNAIEACAKSDGGFIDLSVQTSGCMMRIMVRNSAVAVSVKDGRFQTTKSERHHGIGLR